MKNLLESLLDDNIFNDIDNAMINGWLEKHTTGKFKVMGLKNGTYKINGNITINKADNIPPLNISSLNGSLYIENSNIENLNGLFAEMAKVKGDINITGCPKLNNIAGLPWNVDGDVNITNCPSLKSLDGVKCLAGGVSIMRCGKRFSKSAVESAFKAAIKIYCSEEELIANITESFQDPILIRLYDQLRNTKQKFDIKRMIGFNFQLDKISPSMRQTFEITKNTDAIKAARKIVANTNRSNGFIATESYEGEFIDLYNSDQDVYHLNKFVEKPWNKNHVHLGNVNDILDRLKTGARSMSNIKYIHVWMLPGDITSWQLQSARSNARFGSIDPNDKEQMKELKRAQLDKYKRAVAALKAERGSEKYRQITAKVEALMNRFTKFMNKLIADPKWASNIGYKANGVFDAFRKGYDRNVNTQKYGLIYAFQAWSSHIVKTISQSGYVYGDGTGEAKQLQDAMDWADKELTNIGM